MNSPLIDVALGMALTYAMFSLTCTVVTEWWSRLGIQRARQLRKFIGSVMIRDARMSQKFFGHPLITSLAVDRSHSFAFGPRQSAMPSYIPPRLFALVIMELSFVDDGERRLALVRDLPADFGDTLHTLTRCALTSCQHTQERLENWFTESMKRLTGQYTRYAQTVTLVVAVAVTLIFNVDSVRLARDLYRNPAKSQTAAALAAKLSPNTPGDVEKLIPDFNKLGLPVGWNGADFSCWGWVVRVLGWLLSIGALSLGAPFWFDTLNRIVRLRQTGDKPQPS